MKSSHSYPRGRPREEDDHETACEFLSEFHVGDQRPNPGATEYCSAHMGMAAMGINRDLLVSAWYTGGVDVIDFSDPTNLDEIAYYDPARDTGTWSAYPYAGPLFKQGPGKVPIYASDGVENNALAQGMVVYRTNSLPRPGSKGLVDHLNPQTMDHEMMTGKAKGKGKPSTRQGQAQRQCGGASMAAPPHRSLRLVEVLHHRTQRREPNGRVPRTNRRDPAHALHRVRRRRAFTPLL